MSEFDVEKALEGVEMPGTSKYKINDVVKEIASDKEYIITEIKDTEYVVKSNDGTEIVQNIDISTVENDSIYTFVPKTESKAAESKDAESKGHESTSPVSSSLSTSSTPSATTSATTSASPATSAEASSAEASSAEASSATSSSATSSSATSSSATSSSATSSSATSSSATPPATSATPASVYVIVQISENGDISILDKVPDGTDLNKTTLPKELLINKTQSTFAIKITRKPGCTADNCIDGYELGLDETVSVDPQNELLSEKFLEDSASSSSEESGSSKGASSSSEDYSEKVSYLSLNMSEINENKLAIDDKYINEAKEYALETIKSLSSSDSLSDNDFNKLLSATEILSATDPKNDFFNKESNFDKKIEEKLEANLELVEKHIIVPKYQEYPPENVEVSGYKIKITDRGGSGNCFYYSVYGGFDYIIQHYENFNPFTSLTTFAKDTLKINLNIEITNDKNSFTNLIRSILSHCFLAERDSSDVYERYLNAWNNNNDKSLIGNDNGVESVSKMSEQLAYGLRSVIKNKVREYNKNKETNFFTSDEFATILANNVKMDGVFATEIEVNLLKKILTNCNIILDVMSPGSLINYDTDYMPSKYENYYYIYVRHTGGDHYQQVELYDKGVMCEFYREPKNPVDNQTTYWKFINKAITSSGGSRRKQKSKSKKTRRKYFVYNK